MKKIAVLIYAFLMLETTYMILYSIDRIQSQRQFKEDYLISLEKVKQQGNDLDLDTSQYFITDLVFIDSQSACPTLYEQALPYVLCESLKLQRNLSSNLAQLKTWREHCYESQSDVEQLSLKTKENSRNMTTYLKVCSKSIGPSEYRMDLKNHNQKTQFSKMCAYNDTSKRGYVSERNDCSLNSSEQLCNSNQFLFESQFMIACLDNNSTEAQSAVKTEFSCTDDEIACTLSSRFYCIKNTDKCPIVDIKVNPYKLNVLEEQGYENSEIKQINGYSYLKRNDLLINAVKGLEIIQENMNDTYTMQHIEVTQEGSLNKESDKSVMITHQEINWISDTSLEEILRSLGNRLFSFQLYFLFWIMMEFIFYSQLFQTLLQPQVDYNKGVIEWVEVKLQFLIMVACLGTILFQCISLVNDIFFQDESEGRYTDIKIYHLDSDILSFYWSDFIFIFQALPHLAITFLNNKYFKLGN